MLASEEPPSYDLRAYGPAKRASHLSQCKVCVHYDVRFHFRSSDAKCHACDNGANVGAFVGVVLGGLLVASGFAVIMRREELPEHKTLRRMVRLTKWIFGVFTSAGMRNKLKCAMSSAVALWRRRRHRARKGAQSDGSLYRIAFWHPAFHH